jgi:hypothetical protein
MHVIQTTLLPLKREKECTLYFFYLEFYFYRIITSLTNRKFSQELVTKYLTKNYIID